MGGTAVLLVGVVAWPLVFSHSYFTGDWAEQLWFMWKQSSAIQANHLPTLFLDYRYGVFYPHYAFYGGTLYALTGTFALALGGAPITAYVITYLLGFVSAYGGWYWLGRMSGLGRWSAQAPGVVFITSAYYLTLIYARGDWPEFMGVSSIPLVVASGLCVLRAERLRLWPAVALALSGTLFFGSHSLTIVWGSTVIALIGAAILLCVPQARRELTRVGTIRVAALVGLAVLVNAWFLLPALAYESNTRIATEFQLWQLFLHRAMRLVSAQHLFTLSRASATKPAAAFALSLPILVIAWALVGIAVLTRQALRGSWARVLLICAAMTVLLTVLMTHAELILALPRVYATLQFSYRLESYVLLCLSATVLAILVLVRTGGRRMRLWSWVLAPVLVVSIVGAAQQAAAHPKSRVSRAVAFEQMKKVDAVAPGRALPDYLDVHLPLVASQELTSSVYFPPQAVHDNHVSTVVHLQPGAVVETNLAGPPQLVDVTGAKIVGIEEDGYVVLQIDESSAGARGASGSAPRETISVSPADSLPVVAGRWLTLFAACVLTLGFAALALRRLRERARS